MELKQIKCSRCGGDLIKKGDTYKCNSCNATFVENIVEANEKIISQFLDELKQEKVAALRQRLWQATHAKYLSLNDIQSIAKDIRNYLPEDFLANFFETACSKNKNDITDFISQIDYDKEQYNLDLVVEFMIRNLAPENLLSVNNLIENAFKDSNLKLYNKYTSNLSKEAEKVKKGVYETFIPRDVFIAYSSKDMKKVEELTNFLESKGISCFVAMRNLRHGLGAVENYDRALEEAIDNCKIFVFVSTEKSRDLSCDAVKKELPYVKRIDKSNAPVKYRNNYANMPRAYKKPRIELLLEKHTDEELTTSLVEEFFNGYEWCYDYKSVAARVAKMLIEVEEDDEEEEEKEDISKVIAKQQEEFQRKLEEQQRKFEEQQRELAKQLEQQKIEAEKREQEKREAEERDRLEKERQRLEKEKQQESKVNLSEPTTKKVVEPTVKTTEPIQTQTSSGDGLYNVKLISGSGLAIVKAVQSITNCGLMDAKKIVDYQPSIVLKGVDSFTAQMAVDDIQEAGGTATIEVAISSASSSPKTTVKEPEIVKEPPKSTTKVVEKKEPVTKTTPKKEPVKVVEKTPENKVETVKETPKVETKNAIKGSYNSGDIVYFGSYPTTEVKDSLTKNALNSLKKSTTPFVTSDGQKYYSYNSKWFVVEQIKWKVLSVSDGYAFILAEDALDTVPYDKSSSNYERSSVRKWLNNDFIDMAFTSKEQGYIKLKEVDNGLSSTMSYNGSKAFNSDSAKSVCKATLDRVFLPSVAEMSNPAYGFNEDYNNYDPERRRKGTDFAVARGAYTSSTPIYKGNVFWWLRSPYGQGTNYVTNMVSDGHISSNKGDLDNQCIVPAMYVNISAFSDNGEDITSVEVDTTKKKSTSAKSVVKVSETIETKSTPAGLNNLYKREGIYIYFGEYPMAKITKSDIVSKLNSLKKISSPYVEYNGYKYYYYNSAWFLVEKIKWKILKEDNESALLLAEDALDTVPYNNGSNYYAGSSVRKWLNNDFAKIAFTTKELEYIKQTDVDNSAKSVISFNGSKKFNADGNKYVCGNTLDKVFLPSVAEMSNPAYGFSDDYNKYDETRRRKGTDFAVARGAYTSSTPIYKGNVFWWLRSPYGGSSNGATNMVSDGHISSNKGELTNQCVVPAINLLFKTTSQKKIEEDLANFVIKNGVLEKYEGKEADIILPSDIKEIGIGAFKGNNTITSIILNDELKVINNEAFKDCSKLVDVTFNEGLKTIGESVFDGCKSLGDINLPTSLTSIEANAFSNSGITSLNMDKNVNKISGNIVSNCTKLKTIEIAKANKVFNSGKKANAIIDTKSLSLIAGCNGTKISSGVICIEKEAFVGSGIKSIEINNVSEIKENAFLGCNSLTNVTLDLNIKTIGDKAFYNTPKLKEINFSGPKEKWLNVYTGNNFKMDACSIKFIEAFEIEKDGTLKRYKFDFDEVVIPDTVVSIGKYAFQNKKFTKITIPSSVKSIKHGAFANCQNLKEVEYLGSIKDWVNMDIDANTLSFENSNPLSFATRFYTNDSSEPITNLVIPEGVKIIKGNVFHSYQGLESVVLPNSLTVIEECAFRECKNLKSVKFGNSLTLIKDFAFFVCGKLDNLVFPSSLEFIQHGAFSYTKSTNVTFKEGIKEIGDKAFYCTNLSKVDLPNGVIRIGFSAFDTYSLDLANIRGTTIAEIGPNAFARGEKNSIKFTVNCDIKKPLLSMPKGWDKKCFSSNAKVNWNVKL